MIHMIGIYGHWRIGIFSLIYDSFPIVPLQYIITNAMICNDSPVDCAIYGLLIRLISVSP